MNISDIDLLKHMSILAVILFNELAVITFKHHKSYTQWLGEMFNVLLPMLKNPSLVIGQNGERNGECP